MDETKILLSLRAIIHKGNDYLLIKLANDDSFEPGLYEFPGGKVDAGEDINEALYREIYEETGLMVTIQEPLFYWDEASIKEKYADFRHVSLFFECSVPINAKVKTSFEHDQYVWQSITDISKRSDLATSTRQAVDRLSISK